MDRKGQLVRSTYNRILEILSGEATPFPSEAALSRRLEVSRTVVRKAIALMIDRGLVRTTGRKRAARREIRSSDYLVSAATPASGGSKIRQFFFDRMKSGAIRPGGIFSVLELAEESGCDRSAVREFLHEFGKYGLIEKMPRRMWKMVAIDRQYVADLTETRQMLELDALEHLWLLPQSAFPWRRLDGIRSSLLRLAEKREGTDGETDFWPLDEELYRTVMESRNNRFLLQFHSVVYFVFTLHYHWCLSEGSGYVQSVLALDLELLENIGRRQRDASADVIRRHCVTARTLFSEAIQMLAFP